VKLIQRSTHGLKGEINVTPMIDILLVLLIIFMLISPSLSVGLDSQIPQSHSEIDRSKAQIDEAIVISMRDDLSIQINQEPVAVNDLQDRLRLILKSRTERSVFLQADVNLPFEASQQRSTAQEAQGQIALACSSTNYSDRIRGQKLRLDPRCSGLGFLRPEEQCK